MATDYAEELPAEFYRQPLTARMLADFATCPRKFLLSFFTTREEQRLFRGGPAALHQAVRRAVIESWKRGGPGRVSAAEMQAAFEAAWEGELCSDSMEEEQLHSQGRGMVNDYYEDYQGLPTALVEADVRLTGEVGEQALVAVADLVLEQPSAAGATSWQAQRLITSRRPLSEKELSEDLSAGVLWLLAQDFYGARAPALQILFYDLRQRRGRAVSLAAERAEYLRRDLVSRVARLRRERDFAPRKGKYCRWCRSRAKCPVWRR